MFDEQDRRVIQALLDRVGALERQVELNRQNELERIRAQQEQSARARLLQSLPLTQPQLFPFGPVMYGGQLDMNPGDPRLAIRDAPVRGRSRSPDLHFSSSYRARSPLAQQRDSAHRLPSATQADSSRTGLTSARAQEKGREPRSQQNHYVCGYCGRDHDTSECTHKHLRCLCAQHPKHFAVECQLPCLHCSKASNKPVNHSAMRCQIRCAFCGDFRHPTLHCRSMTSRPYRKCHCGKTQHLGQDHLKDGKACTWILDSAGVCCGRYFCTKHVRSGENDKQQRR